MRYAVLEWARYDKSYALTRRRSWKQSRTKIWRSESREKRSKCVRSHSRETDLSFDVLVFVLNYCYYRFYLAACERFVNLPAAKKEKRKNYQRFAVLSAQIFLNFRGLHKILIESLRRLTPFATAFFFFRQWIFHETNAFNLHSLLPFVVSFRRLSINSRMQAIMDGTNVATGETYAFSSTCLYVPTDNLAVRKITLERFFVCRRERRARAFRGKNKRIERRCGIRMREERRKIKNRRYKFNYRKMHILFWTRDQFDETSDEWALLNGRRSERSKTSNRCGDHL